MSSKVTGAVKGMVTGRPREEGSLCGAMPASWELRRRRCRNPWPSWRQQLRAALLALVFLVGWSHGRQLKEQDGLPHAQIADSEVRTWNGRPHFQQSLVNNSRRLQGLGTIHRAGKGVSRWLLGCDGHSWPCQAAADDGGSRWYYLCGCKQMLVASSLPKRAMPN